VGSFLGVASFTDITREILHDIARRSDVPDPDVQVHATAVFAAAVVLLCSHLNRLCYGSCPSLRLFTDVDGKLDRAMFTSAVKVN